MTVIDNFMDLYPRQLAHYEQLAHLCATMCEDGLAHIGVRAIVTSRPKDSESLRKKLTTRQEAGKADYQTLDDIYRDIADLAGVRIALYFPSDLTRVRSFIRNTFMSDAPRVFPLPKPDQPEVSAEQEPWRIGRQFPGYGAEHFRVRLRREGLEPSQERFAKDRIEIQVASVLMHAWAEVEHDLLYKPRSIRPSEEEQRILDELNGLVILGERGLDRLLRAGGQQLQESATPFKNEYELSGFLYSQYKHFFDGYLPDYGDKDVMGRLDILWEVVRAIDQNTPQKLTHYLSDFEPDQDYDASPFPSYAPTVVNQALFGEYEASSVPNALVNQILYFILRQAGKDTALMLAYSILASRTNPEARQMFERLVNRLYPE